MDAPTLHGIDVPQSNSFGRLPREELRHGRQLAAWWGLVPRQHSTGRKIRLHGISKRGDVYLRTLLIHGVRLVLRVTALHTDPTTTWLKRVQARRNAHIATVALANK